MKFISYSEALAPTKKISVDGLVPNALGLTDGPGNSTPPDRGIDALWSRAA